MPKTRRKTDPTARLSDQMREVLLWAYNYKPPEREPQTYAWTAKGEILVSPGLTLSRVADNYVPWSPSAFIGENPTPSKSTTLSNTLKRLEERGLLRRYSVTTKGGEVAGVVRIGSNSTRTRTTHVQLTDKGRLFVRSLSDDFNLDEYEAKEEHRKIEKQAEGLRFALALLSREQFKQMAESSTTTPEVLSSLEAVNKWLGQAPRAELEQRTRLAVNTVVEFLRKTDEELKSRA